MAPLDGMAALVTGGGSGIGLACAQRLANDGALVTICGRTEQRLADAVAAIGDQARYVVADIADEAAVTKAAKEAAEPLGGLHIVVANAGGTQAIGPLALIDKAAFEDDLSVNVTGTFLTIKAAVPFLAAPGQGGGSIVAVSSIAAALTHPLMAPYSVAKAALDMLVRNAADELGAFGIRVNGVRPGLVPTGASDPLVSHEPTRDDYLAQMPLGRLGTVDDVAAAVRFLAGPESSWITGEMLNVDGGHTLRRGPNLDALVGVHFAEALEARLGSAARA
ncbi:MAG TPA: glucose 1-dehydrogenase [Acidimicrobiales bacterium]|jgi:NAD(P)-dependent dehydrogenase (short-subunit alcohol dehydrogenase family)|nr:glucose 1-dehydrogenase [Acidimicrobiales bacterium]